MQVIEELYFGGIRPGERMCKRNKHYAKALDDANKAKKLLENYMDAQCGTNVLTNCETSIYCFKLGAKNMLTVLTDGKTKEI